MRMWSLHPHYLDTKGLVAQWREGLLAQKVLRGLTKGYKNHSSLTRFKQADSPVDAIAFYLYHIYLEAVRRDYNFDSSKIVEYNAPVQMTVNSGQMRFELRHLKKKLWARDRDWETILEESKL